MSATALSRWFAASALLWGTAACVGDIDGASKTKDPAPADPATPGPAGQTGGGPQPPGLVGPGTAPPTMPAPPSAPVPAGACALLPARVWKLSPVQYTNTLTAVLPMAGDAGKEIADTLPARGHGFSSVAGRLEMAPAHVADLASTADRLATLAVQDPGKLHGCLATLPPDAACVRTFIGDVGARLYRRPLTADEVTGLAALHAAAAMASPMDARAPLHQTVRAMLLSPGFIFRTELGPEKAAAGARVKLTPFERASALSYLLTDGPPDAVLFAAAMRGELETRAQLEAHARRLLASPLAGRGVLRFLDEHLDASLPPGEKSTTLFPDWSASLATDMPREAASFLEQVLWREDARFATLLTAGFSMVNTRLGKIYGVTAPSAFTKTALPAAERGGFLTQPGLLARLARKDEPDIVQRGLYVRGRLLCLDTPPPPPNVNVVPPKPSTTIPQRERELRHAMDPTCAVCHTLFDPLGFAFGRYDAIGKVRTMDAGKPIDATGSLDLKSGTMAFDGALELSKKLVASPEARQCFVTKLVRFALGDVEDGEALSCLARKIAARFEATDGNVLEAVVALATSDELLERVVPAN